MQRAQFSHHLQKEVEKISTQNVHLRHENFMQRVEIDDHIVKLRNAEADYQKLSSEYKILNESRDVLVDELNKLR